MVHGLCKCIYYHLLYSIYEKEQMRMGTSHASIDIR